VAEGAGRVLEVLRRAGAEPLSGEILSHELGVSRAQIWKHVESLRQRGYVIDGAPGGGYRLEKSPDRLYPEEIGPGLETKWLGRRIHYLDTTD
jgi:BirA family biotin operon repressor/biotin-[acetyl-CoA-carboxylase] ligase